MWEINVSDQILTFAYSMLLGVLLCLFYDVFRALRKTGLNSTAAVFITDIVFWIISAFVTFLFLLARTNGELRGYVFLSQLIGFALCRLTVSRIIMYVFDKMFCAASFVVIYASRGILWFCHSTDNFLFFLKSIFYKMLKSVKKLLKSKGEMLYTKKNNVDLEHVSDEF